MPPWFKKTHKKQPPQQLQTLNVPANDVENTIGKNKGGDFLFANKSRTVILGIERIRQEDQRNRKDQHISYESKTRRKNLAMAWIDCEKVYDISRKAG